MKRGLNDVLTEARLQAEGLRDPRYAELLESIGLNKDSANSLTEYSEYLSSKDTEQEKLRADLKVCNKEVSQGINQLSKELAANKKRIKVVIPQPAWVQFGITDSK